MQLPSLIGFHDPGRAGVIRAGKFVECWDEKERRNKWVYVYDIQKKLRFVDGFGIAPCVLEAMEENGIEEIHYVDKARKCTWVATPRLVRERAFLFMGKRGRIHSRGTYLHLLTKWWERRESIIGYPWLQGPMAWLEWTEPTPEPQPEQAQLF